MCGQGDSPTGSTPKLSSELSSRSLQLATSARTATLTRISEKISVLPGRSWRSASCSLLTYACDASEAMDKYRWCQRYLQSVLDSERVSISSLDQTSTLSSTPRSSFLLARPNHDPFCTRRTQRPRAYNPLHVTSALASYPAVHIYK